MRDYGKVHTSFWTSETTRSLSDDGRALALYLLTSAHSTISGVFRLPDGYVCEDMQWTSERVAEGFRNLASKGFANRCETSKWVWIRKFIEWNPPENPNQRKGAIKSAMLAPKDCCWFPEFMRVCGDLLGPKQDEKANPSETLPEPFANQEPEPEPEPDKELPIGNLSSAMPTTIPKIPRIPDCPHAKLIDLFAERLPELPRPKPELWAGVSERAMRARWRWLLTAKKANGARYATDEESGVAWMDRFFCYVAKSDFLMGRSGSFQCTLQWLMTEGNFAKVLQGNYDNREAA